MTPLEVAELIVGALLTVIVLSYLIGDNFLFRIVVHVLIGAGAAYAAVAVIFDVFVARFLTPGTSPIVLLFGLILSGMLLFKVSPRLAWVGNVPVAYLVGVGVATALGGVVLGTLGPQIVATAAPSVPVSSIPNPPPLYNGILNLFIVAGTIITLLSFGFYRTSRNSLLGVLNLTGRRFFLMIALGATFALVFMASAALLFDRLKAIIDALPIGH